MAVQLEQLAAFVTAIPSESLIVRDAQGTQHPITRTALAEAVNEINELRQANAAMMEAATEGARLQEGLLGFLEREGALADPATAGLLGRLRYLTTGESPHPADLLELVTNALIEVVGAPGNDNHPDFTHADAAQILDVISSWSEAQEYDDEPTPAVPDAELETAPNSIGIPLPPDAGRHAPPETPRVAVRPVANGSPLQAATEPTMDALARFTAPQPPRPPAPPPVTAEQLFGIQRDGSGRFQGGAV